MVADKAVLIQYGGRYQRALDCFGPCSMSSSWSPLGECAIHHLEISHCKDFTPTGRLLLVVHRLQCRIGPSPVFHPRTLFLAGKFASRSLKAPNHHEPCSMSSPIIAKLNAIDESHWRGYKLSGPLTPEQPTLRSHIRTYVRSSHIIKWPQPRFKRGREAAVGFANNREV